MVTANWPSESAHSTSAATSASFAFTCDGNNRRVGQTATDKSWRNYPTAAASTTYSVNNLNQYIAVRSAAPSYDAR